MKARTTWITLSVSLAVVLAVMAWVTVTVLGLDADRTRSEQQAVVEEQARLGLWRVDSAMTPILSREVAELDAPASANPAPAPAGVVLRFELTERSLRPLTRAEADQIAVIEQAVREQDLFARLAAPAPVTRGLAVDQNDDAEPVMDKTPFAYKTQSVRNEDEWTRRKASVEDNIVAYRNLSQSKGVGLDDKVGRLPGIAEGGVEGGGSAFLGPGGVAAEAEPATVIRPIWVGGHLLLVRRIGTDGRDRIEGSWLDWPVLRAQLLREVDDLLPHAQLVPVPEPSPEDTERMLATIPARLEPGATILPPPAWSPLRVSLLAGWVIVLLAFAALVLLVRASLTLSERRAAFVSAVTHELRTPLTTFRMYTEMLGEGMVEQKRDRYIATLRKEADRLSGLVENVLAFARIESDRTVAQTETMSAGLLVDRVVDRLRERCESARMKLEVEVASEDREIALRVDATAVEQILFNLVDNAVKYAPSETNPRVRLEVEPRGRKVALHVRDFGPGIAADDARRIFEPFTKAKADAAGTKPGVGLGLALSRQLARQMGGDLSLTAKAPGSDFVLVLPRA